MDKENPEPRYVGDAIGCPPNGIIIRFSNQIREFDVNGKEIGACSLPRVLRDDIRVNVSR